MGKMNKFDDYFQRLDDAMYLLSQNENTLFIGQSSIWDGHAIFKTLSRVPMEKRIEMPVIEDSQMGFSTGLALEGFIPISIYPRWDFLLLAANQMVNHLDKIPIISHGMLKPKVIIRVSAASRIPLDPGPQHCQDHTAAFKVMFKTIEVIDLWHKNEILPAYDKALNRNDGRSTLIVEHADLYHREV
jgi:pyruvate/2-oxoglutarate/acetoin dehydrogenase E1 component